VDKCDRKHPLMDAEENEEVFSLRSIFEGNDLMHVNLLFDGLSNGKLLTLKTELPCKVQGHNSNLRN